MINAISTDNIHAKYACCLVLYNIYTLKFLLIVCCCVPFVELTKGLEGKRPNEKQLRNPAKTGRDIALKLKGNDVKGYKGDH